MTCRIYPTYRLLVVSDEIFSTLANSVRRELLQLLADGPRTAGALAAEFDLSRPAVSEHLHILEQASLVVGVKTRARTPLPPEPGATR